jgi:membrane protein implicated in regulation of membrane protease activity
MNRRRPHERVHADAQVQRVTGWAGAALVALAIAGYASAPGLRVVWLLFLFFGAITLPQVLLWRRAERKRQRAQPSGVQKAGKR